MDEQLRLHRYFGPNVKCDFPAIEACFEHPEHDHLDLSSVAKLVESSGGAIDFDFGTEPCEFTAAFANLAAALQHDPDAQRCVGFDGQGTSWVCLAYRNATVTTNALVLAYRALCHVNPHDPSLALAVKRQLHHARGVVPDPIAALLNSEAAERRIPTYEISPRLRVQQFGQGVCGWHFFEAAQQSDSLTGNRLARDKIATCELLQRLGFPHPQQVAVINPQQAIQAAKQLGFPCVLKPNDRGKGVGITTGLMSADEIDRAFSTARKFTSGPVLVERQVQGHDHRMAVFEGRLAWVYRRTPPSVTGDGATTLAELIVRENASRSNADERVGLVKKIQVDDDLLHFVDRQGFALETVVPANHHVYLRGQANVAQGGTLDDVTADVHPDNMKMAERVARAFRLNAMGLDFMTTDISRSWRDGQSAIIEVNAIPGLSGAGDAHQVLKFRFPHADGGRIPTILVIGERSDDGATAVASLLGREGFVVGTCLHEGTNIAAEALSGVAGQPLPLRAHALALNPEVQSIVISATERDIEDFGLPLDCFSTVIWEDADRPTDPDLEQLVAAKSENTIRTNEFTEESLDEIVTQSIVNHRRRIAVIPDAVLVTAVSRVSSRVGSPCVESTLEVWRMPCIPVASIQQVFRELLQTDPHVACESHLLTKNVVPFLIVEWSRAALVASGHAVGNIEPPLLPPDEHASQVKRSEFQVQIRCDRLDAVRIAIDWSVRTLNHLVDGFMREHAVTNSAADLRNATEMSLTELRQLAR